MIDCSARPNKERQSFNPINHYDKIKPNADLLNGKPVEVGEDVFLTDC